MLERDDGNRRLTAGLDLDVSAWLEETQEGPAEGSPFIIATRPAGKHYDYTVGAVNLAVYLQGLWQLGDGFELAAGLRSEGNWYDYDNRMLDGNTKDDGEPCDFGGCLYTRPADRSDRYFDLAPHVSLGWTPHASTFLYVRLAGGFRPPQTTELYRLQSGQDIADLDSETISSAETGIRFRNDRWLVDAALFAMRKQDSVIRDADGFNVSGGRSRHAGVELDLDALLTPELTLAVAASYAKHVYDFDRVAAQGETFVAGRDIDTAPRWLVSAELDYAALPWLDLSLQWNLIGEYWVDAENAHDYPGHAVWNARVSILPSAAWAINLRLNNVSDVRYADRADYAFGDYRYFPGRGRELFVELRYLGGAG